MRREMPLRLFTGDNIPLLYVNLRFFCVFFPILELDAVRFPCGLFFQLLIVFAINRIRIRVSSHYLLNQRRIHREHILIEPFLFTFVNLLPVCKN